jgi:ribosomal protein S12 methylthiotransferase
MKMKKFAIISLGCSRNLVDSEVIAGVLKESGFKACDPDGGVDVCVVNTCAFIESARKESVDAIMEIAELKKSGKVKSLVVCGCLPQLYKNKLFKSLPEADLILGTSDFPKIGQLLGRLSGKRRSDISARPRYLYDETSPRSSLTPRHYAYVKISEGCSNLCSYCIIPRLRGSFRSRPIDSIAKEVARIAKAGYLKEVDLVGQDTTLFGTDLYGRKMLPGLLKRLCGLDNSVEWIRVMYTHPAHYTDELVDTISSEKKICKYLDLPIQHISDKILKRMNRHTTKRQIAGLVEKLRKRIPGLVLRTSIIVGFPGETDRDFRELLEFLREMKFEKLGAFTYCREEGTKASRAAGQVPDSLKTERFDELMTEQQKISFAANKSMVGKTVKVLIDEKEAGSKDLFVGRTQGDAPEVDGSVYVSGKNVKVGAFCDVEINDALEYDLAGVAV